MAMVKCDKCGNQISDEALVCPTCGGPGRNTTGKRLAIALTLSMVIVSAIIVWNVNERESYPSASEPAPEPAAVKCDAGEIRLVRMNAGVVNACNDTPCPRLTGFATMYNGCRQSVDVLLLVSGVDVKGESVNSAELWAGKGEVFPTGDFEVRLEDVLEPDPRIASVEIAPLQVKAR